LKLAKLFSDLWKVDAAGGEGQHLVAIEQHLELRFPAGKASHEFSSIDDLTVLFAQAQLFIDKRDDNIRSCLGRIMLGQHLFDRNSLTGLPSGRQLVNERCGQGRKLSRNTCQPWR